MKRGLYSLAIFYCALLVFTQQATATHLRGGYITHNQDEQNRLRFYFRFVGYTNHSSSAHDMNIVVNYGNGTSTTVQRKSITPINDNTEEVIFEWDETFPAPGTYTAQVNLINRNAQVLNIAEPSGQLSQLIHTTISINPLRPGLQNGVKFMASSGAVAYVGKPYKYNLIAYDIDGDSLVYSLIAPTHRSSTGAITPVPGYTIPDGFSINKFGELNWQNPTTKGEYSFAVMVDEFRGKTKLSSTVNEIQVIVQETDQDPRSILLNPERYTTSSDGMIMVPSNTPTTLRFFVKNSIAPNTASAVYTGEFQLDHLMHLLTSTTAQRDSADGIIQEVIITPTDALSRNQPYILGTKGAFGTSPDEAREIRAWSYAYVLVTVQMPTSFPDLPEEDLKTLYPNPALDKFTIEALDLSSVLTIYTLDGRVMYQTSLRPGRNTITRPQILAAGYYIYYLQSKERVLQRGRLVLQ